jgi:hypothetical protein
MEGKKSEGETEQSMGLDLGLVGLSALSDLKTMLDKFDVVWAKIDEEAKRTMLERIMDERIMREEYWIKRLQHRVETLKMVKTWIEKMPKQ